MLSLKWFKDAIERVVEKKIDAAFEQLEKESSPNTFHVEHPNPGYTTTTTTVPSLKKIYLSLKMVNDVLTIVLQDGTVLTKSKATAEDFNAAKSATSEDKLIEIVASSEIRDERKKQEAEYRKAEALKKGVDCLANLNEFELKDGSLYLKGINRSLPPLMVEEFLEIVGTHNGTDNDEFQGLKRFFMWCCLNPRAEVADKLFNFLKKNAFKITKQGFFAALRNVVTIQGGTELVQFVSNAYNKIKAVWKKSPNNYFVFLKEGEYKLVHVDAMYEAGMIDCIHCDGSGYVPCGENDEDSCECLDCDGNGKYEDIVEVYHGEKIGNLTELYLDLPNRAENRFTDAHTHTFNIRIGRAVNMDPAACRWNTDDCGAEGLHFTSDEINYVGCGDMSVLVLINPMKVVGIGDSKGRCWEYLPIMTVAREEATSILHDLDFDVLELDESFAIRELENLANKAREGFTAEAKKYNFNLPALSSAEVEAIVKNLDQIKEEISKRIVKID
jgi:hypothetical protein